MRKILLLGVSALALTLFSAAPAAAADELGLSRDGVTFTQTLDGPLFDDDLRLVPGDVEEATFYARNQGGAPALLTVDVLGSEMTDLLDSGDLRVTATAGGTSGSVADAAGRRLLTLPDLADGDVVPITITVELDEESGNETQLLTSDLSFRVDLQQTGEGDNGGGTGNGGDDGGSGNGGGDNGGGAGDGDDLGSGLLPDTGAPGPWWLAALAAVAVGSGSALLISRRTHTQGASHG